MNRKVSFIVILLLLVLALLPTMMVAAQEGLDTSAEPYFGAFLLEGGFLPDPYIIPMPITSGNVDAGALSLGADCRGYVLTAPDIELEYLEPSTHLRFFFVGSGDTTLIVQKPDGSYVCNDDSVGTDPAVDIPNPAEGSYFVWLGTFRASDEFISGYLMISEFPDSAPGAILTNVPNFITSFTEFDIATPEPGTSTTTTTTSSGSLNAGGTATYGTSTLSAGFSPDPVQVAMSSGGSVDTSPLNLGSGCWGYAAENPDYRVEWSGSAALLRLFFVGEGDTTLLVRTPSGEFICNDDFTGTLDPLVDIANPAAGTYEIWVGTFGSSQIIPGTLYITGSNTSDPSQF